MAGFSPDGGGAAPARPAPKVWKVSELTRHIKGDKRFANIPVVMHSSLSSNANRAMGSSVGVDNYVAKFEPALLAETMLPYLQR